MKSICLVLFLALSLTGCSGFSKTARADRAYRKYIRASTAQREKHRKQFTERQRSEMASLRKSPPPVEQQTAEQAPEPPAENQ
jgi:uncharacterized protein YceK